MQVIGQAYQYVFIGALESSIRNFENHFNVHSNPEKTSFKGRTGQGYSFDFNGTHNHRWTRAEVFGECKGYSTGKNLLKEFRVFLAKAYVTSVDYERHRDDYFWFVTNVPFACTEGSGVRNYQFIRETLVSDGSDEVRQILGNGNIDDLMIRSLADRLGVFILTDSFLMNIEISYKVMPGESLWTILKKLHAGLAPHGFQAIAQTIAYKNRLQSPDHIVSGKRIRLSWHGMRRADISSTAEF